VFLLSRLVIKINQNLWWSYYYDCFISKFVLTEEIRLEWVHWCLLVRLADIGSGDVFNYARSSQNGPVFLPFAVRRGSKASEDILLSTWFFLMRSLVRCLSSFPPLFSFLYSSSLRSLLFLLFRVERNPKQQIITTTPQHHNTNIFSHKEGTTFVFLLRRGACTLYLLGE